MTRPWRWLGVSLWCHVLLLLLALAPIPTKSKLVLYDNTQPMRDDQGHIMDAHDGTVQRFSEDGPYFMHAVSYGLCEVRGASGKQGKAARPPHHARHSHTHLSTPIPQRRRPKPRAATRPTTAASARTTT